MKSIKLLKAELAALVAVAALSTSAAFATGVTTTYATGDLFIGFREAGVTNTLAVNLGSLTKFIPTSLGGTWDGTAFNITFGVIPNTSTAVTSLGTDLQAVFGATWANNLTDGTGVHWAVAGQTAKLSNNNPITGLNAKSVLETVARTDPNTVATAPLNFSNSTFSGNFDSFAQGASGFAFKGRTSTDNSSVAYIGAGTDPNNWGTRIGSVGSTFGSGILGEQPLSGLNSGPTDSILDLYLFPSSGSTLVTNPTYLGSLSLNSSGEVSYQVASVPEPGTYALWGVGAALLGWVHRRNRSKDASLAATSNS